MREKAEEKKRKENYKYQTNKTTSTWPIRKNDKRNLKDAGYVPQCL